MRRPGARRDTTHSARLRRALRMTSRASRRDHRHRQRMREVHGRPRARGARLGRAVRGARRDPPAGRVNRAGRHRAPPARRADRRPRRRGSSTAPTAESSATSCWRRRDTVIWLDLPRRVCGFRASCGARSCASCGARSCGTETGSRCAACSSGRLALRLRAPDERPRRHRYPRELARFRVARLRSQAEVDAFLRSCDVGCAAERLDAARRCAASPGPSAPRAQLCHPCGRAEPQPDGVNDVEERPSPRRGRPPNAQKRTGTQPFSERSRRIPRARGPYFALRDVTTTPSLAGGGGRRRAG